MKTIALLGSTGSIGRQVLAVVDAYPEQFRIASLCCGENAELLSRQIIKYKPMVAGLSNPEKAHEICSLPSETTLYTGENALLHCVIPEADVIFMAVTGFCGFQALIQALKMGKTVALANKEALVAGGAIVLEAEKKYGGKIIPVDSEHSAIWQALGYDRNREFKKIILTASGGALRDKPIDELCNVTAAEALAHPNWRMGAKITIDCATMLNKGLEVMEAMWLFNSPRSKIQVLIHPQSIVHSMVEYADNSVIAQLAPPSMELPIQLALTYPNRLPTATQGVDFTASPLTFKNVDDERYPCFALAAEAADEGGTIPCALCGADEAATALFLKGAIKFTEIADYIRFAIDGTKKQAATYESLIYTDKQAKLAVFGRFKERNGR